MNPTDAPVTYKKKHTTDNIEQNINDPMMPIAWTRTVRNDSGKENKILCTTMGAATDLQNESLRRLIVNGVYWSLGMDIPPKADVNYIDDFHPTMYGFDAFTKGVKPANLELKPAR